MNITCNPIQLLYSLKLLILLSCTLNGCVFMQIQEESKFTRNSTVLVGIISSVDSHPDIPVVVAAYSKKDKKRAILHYTTLHELGPYELMVPAGIHNIVAFGDVNRNLTYDKGEPAGQILSAEQVSVPAGGVAGFLDIVISYENNHEIDFPVGSILQPKAYTKFHSTSPGAIADLDDVVFSDEYAKRGYWASLEFFREISGNVYFLEPYDPRKIPILFVHGAAGSPQNWRTFFESIDRSKYQPWFFYYPSGAHIDSMAYLLFWKLQNLQAKYNFQELCITAHSMGGLVARSFLVDFGSYFPSITNFISISTPWGGEDLAEMGVKYAPAAIHAWRDMQPDSEFITSIFQKKMPPRIEHYLFFGHKGNRNVMRPNNDNVVTLASQLDQRSQMGAKMIYGFNEDHVSILSSNEVIAQYNSLLADIRKKSQTPGRQSENSLYVDFTFDYPKDLPRPMPILVLNPVGKKGAETLFYLSPDDTGRKHGPFPSGKYEVSVIAPAFLPEPLTIPIQIENGSVPRVDFTLKPMGYFRGYVVDADQPYIQAGKYRPPDFDVHIETITLSGNGISRTVTPLQGEEVSFSEHHLSETDFLFKGVFFFFSMPTGKYELKIKAKGYLTYTETCDVKIGQYNNPMMVELVKARDDTL